jgi:hypothetical protein
VSSRFSEPSGTLGGALVVIWPLLFVALFSALDLGVKGNGRHKFFGLAVNLAKAGCDQAQMRSNLG